MEKLTGIVVFNLAAAIGMAVLGGLSLLVPDAAHDVALAVVSSLGGAIGGVNAHAALTAPPKPTPPNV